jgi:hypothetical protein
VHDRAVARERGDARCGDVVRATALAGLLYEGEQIVARDQAPAVPLNVAINTGNANMLHCRFLFSLYGSGLVMRTTPSTTLGRWGGKILHFSHLHFRWFHMPRNDDGALRM